MATSEPSHHVDRRTGLAIALIAVGLLLVAASVFLPEAATRGTNWSPEQAKQYQAASVKLHSLSHTAARSPEKQEELRKQLQDAEKEYASRRADLDAALNRPHRVTFMLRVAGVFLAAAGGISAYLSRKSG